jgi:two-component system, OmpR family, catabolic regulation response regulator CreB
LKHDDSPKTKQLLSELHHAGILPNVLIERVAVRTKALRPRFASAPCTHIDFHRHEFLNPPTAFKTPCSVTILLLEDDPAIARTVSYALEREGWVVEHVLLVREAAARLRPAGAYEAAILDVGLPDGSGLDLCRQLRALHAALPIVLLTARGEETDRVIGLELGADDYITKPFSTRELCARVRALLRRAALPAAALTPISQSLFNHDEPGKRIAYANTWLNLTRIEYHLLAVLLRTPGRIWSRASLLDAVWGSDAQSTDRTVDTHIKTLRAKLREVNVKTEVQADVITTHRAMGYSIDIGARHPAA